MQVVHRLKCTRRRKAQWDLGIDEPMASRKSGRDLTKDSGGHESEGGETDGKAVGGVGAGAGFANHGVAQSAACVTDRASEPHDIERIGTRSFAGVAIACSLFTLSVIRGAATTSGGPAGTTIGRNDAGPQLTFEGGRAARTGPVGFAHPILDRVGAILGLPVLAIVAFTRVAFFTTELHARAVGVTTTGVGVGPTGCGGTEHISAGTIFAFISNGFGAAVTAFFIYPAARVSSRNGADGQQNDR